MTDISGMFAPLPDRASTSITVDPRPWSPILPVPEFALVEIPQHERGVPNAVWTYVDALGRTLGRVCRWDTVGNKAILPLTYCRHTSGREEWRWLQMPEPRPLYGLDRIALRGDARVLVVEGEKTADAAGRQFPDLVVTTSPGGSNAAEKADWSPLRGREVIVWPDNDEPGRRYGDSVAGLAMRAGARSVRVVSVPETWSDGWDLADDPPDATTSADLEALIGEAKPASGPDMSVLKRTSLPAPSLDAAFLGPLAPWVEMAAVSKSAPVDYVAMTLLGSCAGIMGTKRFVSPWEGWKEPSILWVMLVGPPSSSKSPAMDTLRDPLTAIEQEALADWPQTWRAYESAKVIADAKREAWEDEARKAVKADRDAGLMPADADAPNVPQMPRIVITDSTIEATATILSGNPRGVILWRDECAAWLGNLEKYGDGDRAFWLEAYGGRPHVVDRKKHDKPVRLDHLAVSVVGGIQPDRLASLVLSADDDGMAARFMMAWPERVKPRRPTQRPDSTIIFRSMQRLESLQFGSDPRTGLRAPIVLPVMANALDRFQKWREEHDAASDNVAGIVASTFGKMPGQLLRLALVIEHLRWAAGPEAILPPESISARSMDAARDLIESYIKPMLLRVLGEADRPLAERNAATLARAIINSGSTLINARDIRRTWRLPGLKEAAAVTAAIVALEEARWLEPIGGRHGDTKGRQRGDYRVDLRVFEGNA